MYRILFAFILIFIPLLSLFSRISSFPIPVSYLDFILLMLVLFAIAESKKIRKTKFTIFILTSIFLIVFINSQLTVNNAYLMELKGFLSMSLGLFLLPKSFSDHIIYRYLNIYFSVLVFYYFIRFLNGIPTRFDLGLVGEVNYDLAVGLLTLCYFSSQSTQIPKKKLVRLAAGFLILALITKSRSALIGVFFNIYLLLNFKSFNFKSFLTLVLGMILLLLAVTFLRPNTLSVSGIDRINFYLEFIEYVNDINFRILFPRSAELPLYKNTFTSNFLFYAEQMGNRNNLYGIYPFMFHSSILRFIAQYGLISFGLLIYTLFRKTNFKMFIFLITLAISMSVFNISYLIILFFLLNNVKHASTTIK